MPILGKFIFYNVVHHLYSVILSYSLLYSCGNKGFAVNSKGSLIWKSKTLFDNKGYPFDLWYKLSPAIHLDRELVIFINTESTFVYVLSSKDGSLQGFLNITDLPGYNGCVEPPILVGDAVYLIKAESGYQISYLYSIPLVKMLTVT